MELNGETIEAVDNIHQEILWLQCSTDIAGILLLEARMTNVKQSPHDRSDSDCCGQVVIPKEVDHRKLGSNR